MCVPLQPRLLCDDCSVTSVRCYHVMHCGGGGGRGGGALGLFADCPLVSNVSRDRPAKHHERSIRRQGKSSKSRQQSGIFGVKQFISVFGLRRNLSRSAHGNAVVLAVTVAIGGRGAFEPTFGTSAPPAPCPTAGGTKAPKYHVPKD